MRYYDSQNFQRHLNDLNKIEAEDTYDITSYLKGAFDIANSFGTTEPAVGILTREDAIQECYWALCNAWDRINWDEVNKSNNPRGRVWAYLKKNIKLDARHKIHENKDGMRIPRDARWKLNETKDVYDFLSMLYPNSWFAEVDGKLGFIDTPPERWDIMRLREAIFDCMDKYLTDYESEIVCMRYGIGGDQMSSKKVAEKLKVSISSVDKTKFKALDKLKNEEVMNYLQDFHDFW